METPFLDQLIDEHQNHIESVEAASYAGIQETRKQLAELEAIKAIIVTHCCKSDSEQLPDENLYQPCEGCTTSCKSWEVFFCKKLVG